LSVWIFHYFEGKLLEDIVDKADCRRLVQALVDPQDPQASPVIDSGVLVVLFAHSPDGLDELDVDLNGVGLALLLVSASAFGVTFVALRCRQAVQVGSLQDPQMPEGLTETS